MWGIGFGFGFGWGFGFGLVWGSIVSEPQLQKAIKNPNLPVKFLQQFEQLATLWKREAPAGGWVG